MTEHQVRVRPEKAEAVEKLRDAFRTSGAVLLTEYRGLGVADLKALRAKLREVGSSYEIVKNTLTLRAAKAEGIEGLDEMLNGPSAVVWVSSDPVGGAKVLSKFAEDHPALVIKGAVLSGAVMTALQTVALSKVDPLPISLGKICGSLTGAVASIAGTLEAPIGRIVYVLDQRAKGA